MTLRGCTGSVRAMRRARFIVIDGADGAGKDVQAEGLATAARSRGLRVARLAFPVYDSFTGRDIVAYQSGTFGELETLNPRLVAYLYAANRVEARPMLEQALAQNDLVIAARYAPSNVAYSAARVPEAERAAYRDWLMALDYDVLRNPREDAVIFLDLPTTLSERLMAKRKLGRRDIHDENRAYREIVREQYHELAKTLAHWTLVRCEDGEGGIRTIDDIATELESIVFGKILQQERIEEGQAA